jgi:hypothetical protein
VIEWCKLCWGRLQNCGPASPNVHSPHCGELRLRDRDEVPLSDLREFCEET